jgi:hypothetical protein
MIIFLVFVNIKKYFFCELQPYRHSLEPPSSSIESGGLGRDSLGGKELEISPRNDIGTYIYIFIYIYTYIFSFMYSYVYVNGKNGNVLI